MSNDLLDPHGSHGVTHRLPRYEARTAHDMLRDHGYTPEGSPVEDTNPKKQFGLLKAPIGNTPPAAILEMERVMAMGGVKYGSYNFRETRIDAMTYVGAVGRHWALWQDGEDVDPETGCLHLAAMMASCALMIDAIKTGMFVDNRSKSGQVRPTLDAIAQGHNDWLLEREASNAKQES